MQARAVCSWAISRSSKQSALNNSWADLQIYLSALLLSCFVDITSGFLCFASSCTISIAPWTCPFFDAHPMFLWPLPWGFSIQARRVADLLRPTDLGQLLLLPLQEYDPADPANSLNLPTPVAFPKLSLSFISASLGQNLVTVIASSREHTRACLIRVNYSM